MRRHSLWTAPRDIKLPLKKKRNFQNLQTKSDIPTLALAQSFPGFMKLNGIFGLGLIFEIRSGNICEPKFKKIVVEEE